MNTEAENSSKTLISIYLYTLCCVLQDRNLHKQPCTSNLELPTSVQNISLFTHITLYSNFCFSRYGRGQLQELLALAAGIKSPIATFWIRGGEPNHCYVKMHSTTVLGTRYTVGHDSESLGGGELKADKKTSRNIYSQPFIKIRIVSKGVLWCTCPTSRLKPAHYTSKVLTSWRDKGILSQLLAAALVSRDHGVEIRRDEDEN